MGFLSKLIGKQASPDQVPDIGRNEQCWCGSGKKYKRCHWDMDQAKKEKILREKMVCTAPS